MALFKISKGSKNNLPATLTEGYCWYTFEDSKFYIDYKDENGVLTRKALSAENAETFCGLSLEELKNEISTQDAVVLYESQTYTDTAVETLKTDISIQDAVILHEAQSYTDAQIASISKSDSEAVASIQDVIDELPTENIDEKALYRLFKATFIHNRHIVDNSKCYIVDIKPEIGEPATNLERTAITAYYDLSDGKVYGYLDDTLAAGFTQLVGTTIVAGWYPAEQLLPIAGWVYDGVIANIGDDPNDSTIRLLLEQKVYIYQNDWIELTNSIVDEKLPTPERNGHFAYTVQRRDGKDAYELHLISHSINEGYENGELIYPYQIPLRDHGVIKTAEPKEDLDAANKGYVDTMIDNLGKTTLVDGKQVVTTGINHSIEKPTQPTSECLYYIKKDDGTYKCIDVADVCIDDTLLVADWHTDNYVTEIDMNNRPTGCLFVPSHVIKVQNIDFVNALIFDENSRLTELYGTFSRLSTLVLPASIKVLEDNLLSNCSLDMLVFKGTPDLISSSLGSANGCKDIYVPWSETDVINANAPWGFTDVNIHYDFPVDVFNMDGSWKTLDDYIDGYTNGDTAKVIKNMKRIDEEGLAKGWYDPAALEKFQNSFNRVYVEQSKNRGIYAKVALTSSGKLNDQPKDYDIDDQEIPYYLGSIPTRLNGSEKDPDFNDTDTRYRVGHIKVPPIDVDNFPTADEAEEFATSKLYVDSAIDKNTENLIEYTDKSIEENNNKENIYYTPNIDNHGVCVKKDGVTTNTIVCIKTDGDINTASDNYFKFTTNFKWIPTNEKSEVYFGFSHNETNFAGYIYIPNNGKTIKTNGGITINLDESDYFVKDKWYKLNIFGKFGGMSYIEINGKTYELKEKAYPVQSSKPPYFIISVGKELLADVYITEFGCIIGTDEKIATTSYKVKKVDLNSYKPDTVLPRENTNQVFSTNKSYIWKTFVRDDNDNVVVNKKFVTNAINNIVIPDTPSVSVSPLAGKKIAYHGDSICESRVDESKNNYNGGGYAKIIADMTGSTYDNRAGSGSVLVSAIPDGQSLSSTAKCIVTDMDNMPDDADIICFEGGINDWFKGCPLGTLSEENDYLGELDTTTVIGALESICRKAINKWPGKPICFVITHKIANGNAAYAKNYNGDDSWSYKELHDVMIQIFNKYSIPYLDMFTEGGLNSYIDIHNNLYFTGGATGEPDKTHPNEEAYKKYYVPKLIKLFESLI